MIIGSWRVSCTSSIQLARQKTHTESLQAWHIRFDSIRDPNSSPLDSTSTPTALHANRQQTSETLDLNPKAPKPQADRKVRAKSKLSPCGAPHWQLPKQLATSVPSRWPHVEEREFELCLRVALEGFGDHSFVDLTCFCFSFCIRVFFYAVLSLRGVYSGFLFSYLQVTVWTQPTTFEPDTCSAFSFSISDAAKVCYFRVEAV